MTMIWNVKNAETVQQAVNNMRHGIDCKPSPSCITKCRSWGQTIEYRRKLQAVLGELKSLACDEYYLKNGMADYNAACEKHFFISKRRGYVALTMKG